MATTITIGRAATNDIVVNDAFPTVSNNHAELTLQDDGRLRYTDHSSNGTTINGLAINNKSMFVTTDDTVRLADSFPIDWTVVYKLMPELQRADSKRTRRIQPAVARSEPEMPAEPQPQVAPSQPTAETEAQPVSRGTERFDRATFERRDSGAGFTGSNATKPFIADEPKPVEDPKPAKRRRSADAKSSGSSVSTIVLCIVVFLAVLAIMAFTVFDDVVKNIM